MKEFKNKTAIITGGSRGIGKTICLEFAKLGANVIFNYARHHQEAKETMDEILQFDVKCESIKCNLNNPDQISNFFSQIKSKYKSIDFLINNAASGVHKKASELEIKHWDWTHNINAKAPWLLSIESSNLMINGGAIVNISSLGSQKVLPNYFSVGTSKAALETITKYLAVELAEKKINVNAISAGIVQTDALNSFPNKSDMMSRKENNPSRRSIDKKDISNLVLFLCSRKSEMIRGQTIILDGGYSLVN
jgi:enoyl-[acyl-carrier protein] reductase III